MDSSRKELLHDDVLHMRHADTDEQPAAALRCLDGVLPEQGLMPGSLVELVSNTDGAGVWTLALLMGWHACGERRSLAVADPERCFYPPAAALKLGIDL